MTFLSGVFVGLLAGASFGFLLFGLMDSAKSKSVTISQLVASLRQVAQTCTRLANGCPHGPTSHGLNEVAVELIDKSEELEKFYFE